MQRTACLVEDNTARGELKMAAKCADRWACPYSTKRADADCPLHSDDPKKSPSTFIAALNQLPPTESNLKGVFFPDSFDPDLISLLARPSLDLSYATFFGEVEFKGAHTSNYVRMQNVIFEKSASFEKLTFGEGADFSNVRFFQRAAFNDIKFQSQTSFTGAHFKQEASLTSLEFGSDCLFDKTVFEDQLFITDFRVMGRCDFSRSKHCRSTFTASEFSGDVSFQKAHFSGKTLFKEIEFKKHMVWQTCEQDYVEFAGCQFDDETLFSDCNILGSLIYSGCLIRDGFLINELYRDGRRYPAHIVFNGITFLRPGKAIFDGVNFQKCEFSETDIRLVEFRGALWPEKRTPFGKRKIIFSPEFPGEYDWRREHTYRQLKQNYEDRRDYEKAGDFYYGEMEEKRKRSYARRYLPSLTTLYWMSSGYGQAPFHAFYILAILVGTFTFVSRFLGLDLQQGAPFQIEQTGGNILLFYTFRIVTFQSPVYFEPQTVSGEVIAALARFVIPLQFTLMVLAIRRKFKW